MIDRINKHNLEFKSSGATSMAYRGNGYRDKFLLSKICGSDGMFSSYEDAMEFYRNNYPIQTRKVLVEKYPISTGQLLKFWEEQYIKEKGELTLDTIVEARRQRISKLLNQPITGVHATSSEDYKVWDMNDKDFTSIYELF